MTDFISESVTWTTIEPVAGGEIVSTVAWDPDDPIALRVTFHEPAGPVEWLFSRELLAQAFESGYAGDCDVKIGREGASIILALSSTGGVAGGMISMKTPAAPLRKYLSRTIKRVPIGKENTDAAVDDAIRKILEDV